MNPSLKINPEFEKIIPELSEYEFEQLEENIVSDGEVYEPIVAWNGTIVDGHNRWRIIQEHPEIPYKVKEMQFDNKWAAFAWMLKKQLGRRNLTKEQIKYLMGKRNEAEKLARGANQHTKQEVQNGPAREKGKTAQKIADEYGVGYGTVLRAEKFAKGVDSLREVSDEAADKLLSGKATAVAEAIYELVDAPLEDVKAVADDIIAGNPVKPRGYTKEDRKERKETEAIVAEMYDTSTIQEATVETLIDDIVLNAAEYVRVLKNTLTDHSTLLTPENKPIVAKVIQEHIIDEIMKLKGIVER